MKQIGCWAPNGLYGTFEMTKKREKSPIFALKQPIKYNPAIFMLEEMARGLFLSLCALVRVHFGYIYFVLRGLSPLPNCEIGV